MTLARHATPVIALVAGVVAAAVIVPLSQYLYGLLQLSPSLAPGPATGETLFTLVMFGALLGVAAIGITLDKSWRDLPGRAAPIAAAAGFAIGVVGFCYAAGGAFLAGEARHGTGVVGAGVLVGTLVVFFQSAVEEVYFRGWLQPLLARAWGPAAGVGVTAAAFAGLHIAGGDRSLVTMLNLLLGGIMFGLMALRSGGIVLPIAAHFGWNWAEGILLGLAPNPGVGNFGSVVDLDMAGSALWGGSPEGINASLGMSFALVAIILPLAVWRGGRFSLTGVPG